MRSKYSKFRMPGKILTIFILYPLLNTPLNRAMKKGNTAIRWNALRADVKAIYPMEICGQRPLGALYIAAAVAIPVATHHHDHHDKSSYTP
jgi:hypothetical protein